MSFLLGFIKTAYASPHTRESLVKSTPKSKGGKDGVSHYFLRYHKKEKRWSCTCPDWQYRRKSLQGDYKEHHDCKHIKAKLKKKKSWEVEMPKFTRAMADKAKSERE